MTASPTASGTVTELERRILTSIETREADLFDRLETLVRFRTPNPPGGNEGPAQDWIEERLRALGLEVDRWEVLPGRPNVVGIWRGTGGGPSVALNGHIDVCEDRLLEEWSSDAYDPVRDGRDMIGRGATDMKSATASFLFALEVLHEHGFHLRGDVILQSVIGEEAGEPGARSAIERGYGGDFGIVGESSSGRGLVACIGVMNCRVTIESPYTLHLVHRKFTINAGGKLEGANCIEKLATRILPALNELEREWAVFKTHELVPPGACNINLFRIEGGANTFILPDRCVAYFTVTYLPNEQKEAVISEVAERIHAAAALDPWLMKHPPQVDWDPSEYPIEFAPSEVDASAESVQILREAIEIATGQEAIIGGRGGITDAGWFQRAGIPVVVFGPGDVNYAHAINERVHLDDVVNHCKATALFLLRYCRVVET